MDLIVSGGTVVTAEGSRHADVAIRGGTIAAIEPEIAQDGVPRIDASGCFVLPGVVDVHTHVRAASDEQPDRFFADSVAAACGGTTTFVAFAWQPRGGSLMQTLREWRTSVEADAAVDHAASLILTDPRDEALREMPRVIAAGVPSFKAFMVYEYRVNDADLFSAMQTVRGHGGLMQVHCENCTIVDHLVQENLAAGRTQPRYHMHSRPVLAEAEATHRAMALAAASDAPVYAVHVSSADALAHVAAAKARGQAAFAETCPHYLTLTSERYDAPDDVAARYVVSPPLRDAEHREALWRGVRDGAIDLVSTDHVPDRLNVEKHRGAVPFDRIGNGAPGIETLLALVYSEGVARGRITIERMVDVLSTTPAHLFGLRHKGAIAVGRDADLVVFDPAVRRTVHQAALHHSVDFTPYEGLAVEGGVRHTLLRGSVIVENGAFVGRRGGGRFVEREPGR